MKLASARDASTDTARSAIDEASELISQSVEDTRSLTFELSPPVLYDLGIKDALSWLVEEIEKRHDTKIELVDDEADKPLDDATAALAYRAVRELLLNVVKHAKARTARLSLRRVDDHFAIDVEDCGAGFDPGEVLGGAKGGFGLFNVREQVRRLGGTVDIVSAPREGTRVSVRIPIRGPTEGKEPAS
jgi:signal transduction histidine kinase